MPTELESPLTAVVDMIADALAERIEKPAGASAKARYSAEAIERVRDEVELWRPYAASEVADFLGISRSSVYEVPEDLLHPTWVGPGGGSKRFLGINVLMYISGLPPVDVQHVAERVREDFVACASRPVNVRPMKGSGKQRVM